MEQGDKVMSDRNDETTNRRSMTMSTNAEYHKIQTVYLRDPDNKFRTLLEGQFAKPEFEHLAECEWEFTEKVDGTNVRVIRAGDLIEYRGKTDNSQLPVKLFASLHVMFNETDWPNLFGDAIVCLYGEGYGAKIQKGGDNYRSDQSFVLFDVTIDGLYLRRADVDDIAVKLGIESVPVIGHGTLAQAITLVRDGFSSMWGKFKAEGIVARPTVELLDRRGDRVITKIKCKDFQ